MSRHDERELGRRSGWLYGYIRNWDENKPLNKEILRLSIPSILANLTIPLVGLVDTAVAGHLPAGNLGSAAAFIGAISLGAMLFNLLYWNFGFLRGGTGGLTAQAFGSGNMRECGIIILRGLGLAFVFSILILLLQEPFVWIALRCTQASEEVETLAREYFSIRIWAAPATLGLMVLSGWFVGMQDSLSSMWKDLIVNGVNISASLTLALGAGRWEGMGFPGVALGTVIAQYCGLLFCLLVISIKYGGKVFKALDHAIKEIADRRKLRDFYQLNRDLFGRSLGFTFIYIGYTVIAAKYGDITLACSSIMMQLLMIFSYFTDGFAYAGEALTGRFIGARDAAMLKKSILYVFIWSMGIALLFVGIYALAGKPMISILTDDGAVVSACSEYLPWLLLMPLLGCAAFTWDGVYMGATASRGIFLSMAGAAVCFFAVWFAGKGLIQYGMKPLNILMAAYFAHLAFRTFWLSLRYRKDILIRIST